MSIAQLFFRSTAVAAALPTFVSGSANRVNGTTVTVTAPTGIQNGDLLIAIAENNGTTAITWTLPSGFTNVNQNTTTVNNLVIGKKIASSESGNYAFSWTNSNQTTCSIMVYRNATTIDTFGTPDATSNVTSTAPSITPTKSGTLMFINFYQNTGKSITTPPSGMTSRFSYTAGNPVLSIYDFSPQGASASGTKSITWDSGDQQSAQLIQIVN